MFNGKIAKHHILEATPYKTAVARHVPPIAHTIQEKQA